MRVGVITGSGSYDWPALEEPRLLSVATEYGQVAVTEGRIKGVEVVHLSRHGDDHQRLSHQVAHKANPAALPTCEVRALVSFTACGAVDPAAEPGSVVDFDDLYFPSNRLPDGTPCTWYHAPGVAGRGHWIFDCPFSEALRQALIEASADIGFGILSHGAYGQVDGPRFNSPSEIAALARVGVTAVSRTAGPEVVPAGEAELPMAPVGWVTDYANGVTSASKPVRALLERMAAGTGVFTAPAEHALPRLSVLSPVRFVHRFDA